jgi:hypothetical protein
MKNTKPIFTYEIDNPLEWLKDSDSDFKGTITKLGLDGTVLQIVKAPSDISSSGRTYSRTSSSDCVWTSRTEYWDLNRNPCDPGESQTTGLDLPSNLGNCFPVTVFTEQCPETIEARPGGGGGITTGGGTTPGSGSGGTTPVGGGGSSGGTSGGTTPPPPPPTPEPEEEVPILTPDFSQIDLRCVNQGGGIMINGVCMTEEEYYLEQAADLWEDQIYDGELAPCMKSILADLKNLTIASSVGQIVQNFSGTTTPGFNWEVRDGSLPQNENARTGGYSFGKVTTTFDVSKFENASDLSVARTILHEAVHAYLVAYFRLDQESAMKQYPMLVQDYREIGGNEAHHNEFMRNFVDDIGSALREYGQSKGYDLPDQFYSDLAWGGLAHTQDGQETAWFQALNPDPAVRQRINNVVSVEQSGNDLTGTPQAQNGNDSGC